MVEEGDSQPLFENTPPEALEHTSYFSVTQSRRECKKFQVRGIFHIEHKRDPCVILHTMCTFTHSVLFHTECVILQTLCNFTHNM